LSRRDRSEQLQAPLSLEHRVFGVSFGLLDGRLLLDPTAEEEALLSTSFTLLLDSDGAFRGLHKPGGAPLDEATTRESLAAARKRLPALVAASSAKRAGLRF